MKTHSLLTLLFICIVTSTATAQEFTFSSKGKLKRGGSTTIVLVATSPKPITINEIKPVDTQGFTVEVLRQCPCPIDGTQTFDVKISRPFFTGIGGPNAGEKSIDFTVNYTVEGKMQSSKPIPGAFTYSTAAVVYYFYGIVGILLGFAVKSLIAKQSPTDADGKPLQITFMQYLFSPKRLGVVLFLGFAVLLYSDIQGTTLYGFRESILLGLATGILGDEGLVQKISALRT